MHAVALFITAGRPSVRLTSIAAFALAGAVAACGGAPQPPPPPPTAHATGAPSATEASISRARAVLDAYRRAAGGDRVAEIHSLDAIGASNSSALPKARILHLSAVAPLQFRQEESPGSQATGRSARAARPGGAAADLRVVIALDGEQGWMASTAPLAGDRGHALPSDIGTRAARQAFVDTMAGTLPTWVADTGRFTFTDGGMSESAGGGHVLDIDGPDGHAGHLLFDAATSLPRVLTVDPDPRLGASAVGLTITFGDFRDVAGVKLPHKIVRVTSRGVKTTWTIAHYTLNHDVPQAIFAPGR